MAIRACVVRTVVGVVLPTLAMAAACRSVPPVAGVGQPVPAACGGVETLRDEPYLYLARLHALDCPLERLLVGNDN